MSGFYEEIRSKTDQLWQRTFNHSFVQGIGDGSLSHDRYKYFLKQDYLYLIDFSRVFALGAAKAHSVNDMGYFAALLNATLNMEMDLHRKTCQRFGIALDELEQTEKSMITMSYTNLLLRTCYEGNIHDVLAVLLPCGAGYTEIGQKLKSEGMPEDPFYRDWVNTYASDEFAEFTEWLINKMNEVASDAPDYRKKQWYRLYLSSARFEYLFFDMSWKMDSWPDGLPE